MSRRFFISVLAIPFLVGLLVAAMLAWVAATETGLRIAARIGEKALAPDFRIEAPTGSLLGSLRVRRVVFETPERTLLVEDLQLDWQPRRLLDRLLLIDRLSLGRLQITSRPSDKKPERPQGFELPFAMRLEQFHVGEMAMSAAGAKPRLPITGIAGRFTSDGVQHRLEELRLATSRFSVSATASLRSLPPFPVTANARISGVEMGHPVTVAIDSAGTLEDLLVEARATSGKLKVDGAAKLNLLAAQPLREGTLSAADIDPATWVKNAPHARLRVDARFAPAKDGSVVGNIAIFNSQPGRLDEQRVPLRRLDARLRQRGERLEASSFTATIGDGRLGGAASWDKGQLALDAKAAGIDVSAWHQALTKTRLDGDIAIKASAASQSVKASLRDPRFRLLLDAVRHGTAIRLHTLRLDAGAGRLALGGNLDPQGEFAVEGRLERFDPSLLVNIPSGRLNADLAARGRLAADRNIDLHFDLRDSRFAGRPVAGHGSVVVRRERLVRTDIVLEAGDNRLKAHGSLGAPGDTLNVGITANRLEDVGLRGSLQGEVRLSGALRLPGIEWNLKSPQFAVPGTFSMRDLAFHGRFEPNGGAIGAALDVAAVDLEKNGPSLTQISANLDGRRSGHRLKASARIGKDHALVLAASGALGESLMWKGQLESLEWRGPQAVRLSAPTRLEAGPRHVRLERTEIGGSDWEASIGGLRWQPGRLQTTGRFSRLPLRVFLPPAAASATSLRVGGEWDIDFGRNAEGRVRIYRQDGDIAFTTADKTSALGVERLALQADARGHNLEVSLAASASRAGTVEGRLSAGLLSEDGRWSLARHAPWRGNIDLDMRSMDWLGALAGSDMALAGKLRGTAHIRGSPAAPMVNGELAGNELRIQVPQYGVDLGGGTLRVQFTPEEVRLQQLELMTVATQLPNAEGIDFRRFANRSGRLVAEGRIEPQKRAGRIHLRADQLAISELPGRWVMVSGTADVELAKEQLQVRGKLAADAAYVEIAPADRPKLSPDVVVVGREEKKPRRDLRVGLDLAVDLGERFYFRGAGIDTRLAGGVRLSATRIDQLRGEGSLRTVGGTFAAYGQELVIERGILNFQGLVTNPGLNVRAMRKNMAVEAGVEVSGTVKNPIVKLVSVPDVPDPEKLSWMVLGRPPGESVGKQDADLLLSAAMSLRGAGKQQKGGVQSLTAGLGLEELSLSSGTLGESRSSFPSSHVAGSFSGGDAATASEQIATVGKRFGSNALLSYERSINTAESVLKLTVELTRRLSLIGRVGADNGVGFLYSFSFGGGDGSDAKSR